jgi:hypothetical protein
MCIENYNMYEEVNAYSFTFVGSEKQLHAARTLTIN